MTATSISPQSWPLNAIDLSSGIPPVKQVPKGRIDSLLNRHGERHRAGEAMPRASHLDGPSGTNAPLHVGWQSAFLGSFPVQLPTPPLGGGVEKSHTLP